MENGGYSEQSTHKENDSTQDKNFYSSLPVHFEPWAFSICFQGARGNHCNFVESIDITGDCQARP